MRREHDGDRAMRRRLALAVRGLLELLAGLALIGTPLVLGLGPVALSARVGAAGLDRSDGLPIGARMAPDPRAGLHEPGETDRRACA